MHYRSGFSFVQLLVVLSIMGVLMGLMTVGVRKGLQYSHRVKCSHNLKQIYQYLMLYLEDESGQSFPLVRGIDEKNPPPGSRYLKDILQEYAQKPLDDIFTCPDDPRDSEEVKQTGSYDIRDELVRGTSGIPFSQIKNKGQIILMGDFRSGWHDHQGDNQGEHEINVLFADGHTEYVNETEWQKNISKPLS